LGKIEVNNWVSGSDMVVCGSLQAVTDKPQKAIPTTVDLIMLFLFIYTLIKYSV
jgi:hypothetical protein